MRNWNRRPTGCTTRSMKLLPRRLVLAVGAAFLFASTLSSPTLGQGAAEAPRPTALPGSFADAAGLALAEPSRGGGFGPALAGPPRVSGLSIVVQDVQPAGAGRQVDFDVVMSTERLVVEPFTTFYSLSTVGTTGGQYVGFQGAVQVAIAANQALGGYPSLGRVSTTRTLSAVRVLTGNVRFAYEAATPRGIADGTTAAFTGSDINRGSELALQATVGLQTMGPLPGIDFGDGSTSATVPLTEQVSSTTVETQSGTYQPFGPLKVVRTRYRRSGLSHVYSDLTPHTIRAVSGCCAAGDGPGGTVETLLSGTFIGQGMTSTRETTTRVGVSGSFQFNSTSVQAFTVTNTGTPVLENTSMMDTNTISQTLGIYPLALKTASVQVGSVLEIPVSGPWGTSLLAVALFGMGVLLLRRST